MSKTRTNLQAPAPDEGAERATSVTLTLAELRPLVKALNYMWDRLSLVPVGEGQEVAAFDRGVRALEDAIEELEDAS